MPEQEQAPKSPLDSILSQIGLSSDFAQKIRFKGPVGKLALLGVIAIGCLGGVGLKSSTTVVQITCAGLVTLVVLAVGAGIIWYSDKHPEQATLEGMEVVVLHQQKAWAAAAKGHKRLPESPVVPSPHSTPPQLNPPEAADQ